MDANCISEIAVNYRNGPDETIDIAKLKDSTTILKVFFPIQGTQLGTEYILMMITRLNINYIIQEIDEQSSACRNMQIKLDEIYQRTVDKEK